MKTIVLISVQYAQTSKLWENLMHMGQEKSLFPLKNQTPVFKIATITVHRIRA